MIRWLKLAQPAVSLNAPGVKILQQKYTQIIPEGLSAADIVRDYVPSDARHLIFNCHGTPDPMLALGKRIHAEDADAFLPIAGMMDLRMIWLSACNVAGSTPGHNFLKKLAAVTNCIVVGHTMAIPDRKVKANCIEDYIYAMRTCFMPNGELFPRELFYTNLAEWGLFEQL